MSLPGVRAAFERLRTAGTRIALTTGFDRVLVEQLLAARATLTAAPHTLACCVSLRWWCAR